MHGYLNEDELMHYGVLGMKWGVRRYQNKYGSLTSAGKKKSRLERAYEHQKKDAENLRKHGYHKEADAVLQVANKTKAKIDQKNKTKSAKRKAISGKKAIAIGVGATAAALGAYGAYKLYDKKVPKYIKRTIHEAGRIDWPIAGDYTHYESREVREILNPKRKVFKGKDPRGLLSRSSNYYKM